MPSPEYIFLYVTLLVPFFGAGVFVVLHCFKRPVFVVEPIMLVQSIHATEPLNVAQAIESGPYSDLTQIAEPLPL